MATRVLNKRTGLYRDFGTRLSADLFISNNYEDPNFYQGSLPEVIVRTPEALRVHELNVKNLTVDRNNPEAVYRMHDRQAMSNPANPYAASLGWIGFNTSIAGTALPLAISPILTAGNITGGMAGNKVGNYASDYLYSNPDDPFLLNTDIAVTPRQATSFGTGLASGIGLGKFLKYGTTERVIGGGAETPEVTSRPFSLKVRKKSMIPPEDMEIKNEAGFLPSAYKGLDSEGYYIYEQPKAWMPKNPRRTLNGIVRDYVKKGYYPTDIDDVEGPTLINPVTQQAIGDLGRDGSGQVGWTLNKWFWPTREIVDGGVLPAEEFLLLKLGGKVNG